MTRAVAYLRTSSATNVGKDKDSDKRQRAAIEAYAASADIEIVAEFYDAAVSGADRLAKRKGWCSLMSYVSEHGVSRIIVETASRFARDTIIAETGYRMLKERGICLIAADSPRQFLEDTPTSKLIRQILSVVSEFQKDELVEKLRGARDRKSEALGRRVEGRKADPALVAAARSLRALEPSMSLRELADTLAGMGYRTKTGKPLGPSHVRNLLKEH